MTRDEVIAEITQKFALADFLLMQERLAYLRKEEQDKLKALAELQSVYVSAVTDQQRDAVRNTVVQIRELSRKTREEIRSINNVIYQQMELARAKELYEMYLASSEDQSPK